MLVIVWGKTIGYKKHKYFLVTAIVWSITMKKWVTSLSKQETIL